jgi:hypothetical protein
MKIWSFEGNFVKFLGLGTSLELFLKTQGLDCELLDHGLITQNPGTFVGDAEQSPQGNPLRNSASRVRPSPMI